MSDTITVEVELLAFGGDGVRPVEIPAKEFVGSIEHKLERVFYYGQNDFQPKAFRSVSVGDVIRLEGAGHYRVASTGFERLVKP